MYDIIGARAAAKVIGCGASEVRYKLRIGVWKFGRAISPKESGKKQWGYEINKKDLADFLKIDLEEVNRRLGVGKTESPLIWLNSPAVICQV